VRRHSYLVVSLLLAACSLAGLAGSARAQAEELLVGSVPFENSIVGRDLALRLRTEVQMTTDDDDLIEDDIAYSRFPSEMIAGEAKLILKDRTAFALSLDRWDSEQDHHEHRLGWRFDMPAGSRSRFTIRYRRRSGDIAKKHYFYGGYSCYLMDKLYSYSQLRYTDVVEGSEALQASQYLSWTASRRFRLGGQAGAILSSEDDGDEPWYVRGFSTVFLIPEWTSLRGEVRHYDSSGELVFQEYRAMLYQKILDSSLLRLDYRYYRDDSGLKSHGYGLKLRHYFSARCSGHVGYRRYDHNEGTDLDSVLLGLGLLL